MPANPIRDIFIARIKQLLSQYEESKAIDHGPTVGAMREQYLKDFLRDMLPPKFSPVSGFIADMNGNITPQLDMIFIDHSELPTVSLVNDTVIVPAEIALLTAEVKSILRTEHLEQIKKQREAIEKFPLSFLGSWASAQSGRTRNRKRSGQTRDRKKIVSAFIIAFDSDISDSTLLQWVEKEGPIGICVVNRSSVFQLLGQGVGLGMQKPTGPDDYEPLLTFIGVIYRWLYTVLMVNSTMSDQELDRFYASHCMWFWEGYLSEFLIEHFSGLPRPNSP